MPEHDDLPAPPAAAEEIFGERIGGAVGYAGLLATTGVDHGLIGPREIPRLWERHILNCAVVERLIGTGAIVGDVGSGAGLPGLALAIARPDMEVHLIEPLARRTVWLQAAVTELGLDNVTVHRARAEGLAGRIRFDVVTARAVARLEKLVEWSAPLLTAGGELIAFKGVTAQSEVDEDIDAIVDAGGVHPRVEIIAEGELEVPTTVVRVRFPRETPVPGQATKSKTGRRAAGKRGKGGSRGGSSSTRSGRNGSGRRA